MAVVKLLLLLVVLPAFCGGYAAFILPRERVNPGMLMLTGYLVWLCVFGVIAIPCELLIQYGAFDKCVLITTVVMSVVAVAGGFLLFGRVHVNWRVQKLPIMTLGIWALFFVCVLFQIYMAISRASFDGDDAYYVTESVLADQTGTMNTILPYTGGTSALDIRHALAVITMWIAYIARMSGVHAAVVSHTVMPVVFLTLTYLAYAACANVLFGKDEEKKPVFMLVTAFLQMFGNVSIYTNETFLMTRTWQGKSVFANLVIPMLFYVFFRTFRQELTVKEGGKRRFLPYPMLFMLNMAAGVCTSMGVMLTLFLTGVMCVVLFIATRRIPVLYGTALCCVPNVVYMGLYWGLLPSVFK